MSKSSISKFDKNTLLIENLMQGLQHYIKITDAYRNIEQAASEDVNLHLANRLMEQISSFLKKGIEQRFIIAAVFTTRNIINITAESTDSKEKGVSSKNIWHVMVKAQHYIKHFKLTNDESCIVDAIKETLIPRPAIIPDLFANLPSNTFATIIEQPLPILKLEEHDMQRRQSVMEKLDAYIKRIESHRESVNKSNPDFAYGFIFFSRSRAINRKANYELAKNLYDQLQASIDSAINADSKTLASVFSSKNLNACRTKPDTLFGKSINSKAMRTIISEVNRNCKSRAN